MSGRHLVHVVSIILLALAVALAATTLIALAYGGPDVPAFTASTLLTATLAVLGYRRSSLDRDLTVREGYAVVSLSWIAIGVAGALPYLLSGATPSPIDALFESMSGFTTTGATIFVDIEALPRGILFWRALTQWIGGMGIIVLGVAILPFLGVGGMQLFRAEVPGPTPERLQPRIAQTAKALWLVYAGLTLAQVGLYLAGGLSAFDAVTHALTTLSTGGFSPRNASIAAFDSGFVQYVTIAFMYLAGINFTLHYRALGGRPGRYLADAEWRAFTVATLGAAMFIAFALFVNGASDVERTLRDALFQAVSLGTTTGFVTADYALWPVAAQLTLLVLMLGGGMSGSTAGGMKIIRLLAFLRQGVTSLKRALHPRAVLITRIGNRAIREDDLSTVLGFILFYLVLFVAGTIILAFLGHDLETAVGASAACLGNIGPGLGAVGAVENYAGMGTPSHIVLMFLMLVGRLEIFTVLLLFHPDLWRRAGPR